MFSFFHRKKKESNNNNSNNNDDDEREIKSLVIIIAQYLYIITHILETLSVILSWNDYFITTDDIICTCTAIYWIQLIHTIRDVLFKKEKKGLQIENRLIVIMKTFNQNISFDLNSDKNWIKHHHPHILVECFAIIFIFFCNEDNWWWKNNEHDNFFYH